jgi:Arc/MetJ family transcription regulator
MGTHMKTTIEIADDLLERAKRQARLENKTLREVVEEALRRQLAPRSTEPFRLKRHAFKGKGLRPPLVEGQWETIRDLIYRVG